MSVSNTSGLAGIAHWINSFYHLKGEQQLDKSNLLVHKIKEWVDKEYEGGRITVITDAELVDLINRYKEECGMGHLPEVSVE